MSRMTEAVRSGSTVTRYRIVLPVCVLGLALAQTAHADVYIANNTTIDSAIYGAVIVGFDHALLQGLPPPVASSPTLNILAPALLASDGTESGVSAYNASIVNMYGGLVLGGIVGLNQSTINMSGGEVSYFTVSQDASANLSGGVVHGAGFLGNSIFTMSGGQIGLSPQDGDVTIANLGTLSGGTITGDVSSGIRSGVPIPPATINLYGTTVGGGVFLDSSNANLVAGSVGGDFTLTDVSKLTMTGGMIGGNISALNLSSVSIANGSVAQDVSVGGALSFTGGSIGGDVTVGGILDMSGGTVGGDMTILGAGTTGSITGGGITYILTTLSGAVVGISGTTMGQLKVQTGSEVNFASGSVIGMPLLTTGNNVVVSGGSTLRISSGSFADGLNANGANTRVIIDSGDFVDSAPGLGFQVTSNSFASLTVHGGNIPNGIQISSSSQAVLDGGNIGSVAVSTSGNVTLAGSDIAGDVSADTNSSIGMSAGHVDGTINVKNASSFAMSGGTANAIVADQGGAIIMFDGFTHDVSSNAGGAALVWGGIIDNQLLAIDGGYAGVYGGDILSAVARNDGMIDIYGGNIDHVFADGGEVNIFGGHIEPNTLANIGIGLGVQGSLFNINGSDLRLSNPYAGIFSDNGTDYSGVFWELTGTLTYGDTLSTRYFDFNGSLAGAAGIVLVGAASTVPLPAGFWLFCSGLLGLFGIARRRDFA
jgi:hypothetical protein